MSLHHQPLITAAPVSRKSLPQDAPPMHAPAKPAWPPCRRAHRWALRPGRPWALLIGPGFVPA
jgi:hypothetical protein